MQLNSQDEFYKFLYIVFSPHGQLLPEKKYSFQDKELVQAPNLTKNDSQDQQYNLSLQHLRHLSKFDCHHKLEQLLLQLVPSRIHLAFGEQHHELPYK